METTCIAILNKQKRDLFSFKKLENRRAEQVLSWVGVGTRGMEEDVGKGHGRVSMVQMLCMQVCKWKNAIC
jgi:hypothetical protein